MTTRRALALAQGECPVVLLSHNIYDNNAKYVLISVHKQVVLGIHPWNQELLMEHNTLLF